MSKQRIGLPATAPNVAANIGWFKFDHITHGNKEVKEIFEAHWGIFGLAEQFSVSLLCLLALLPLLTLANTSLVSLIFHQKSVWRRNGFDKLLRQAINLLIHNVKTDFSNKTLEAHTSAIV